MSIPRDHYIGEPGYPAPWTTKQPREGLRDLDEAKIVSLSPDVCLTPVGSSVVPIPYPIVDFCGHDYSYTPTVRFTGKQAMVMRSRTTHVHGDAAGTKKGIKSGTVEDVTEPIDHAAQVRAEGSNVIRHLDRFWMNSRNTVGEAIFVRRTQTYDPPKDDDPVPGSLRWGDKPVLLAQAATGTMTDGALSHLTNQSAGSGSGASAATAQGQTTTAPGQGAPRRVTLPGVAKGVPLRVGIWGLLIEDAIRDMKLPEAERNAEARSFGVIHSPAGRAAISANKLLAGRTPVTFDSIRDGSAFDLSSKYGIIINAEERVPLANDILSSLAGRQVDVRTMSDAQVQNLLSPFQGLSPVEAEQKLKEIMEARQREQQEERPEPNPPPRPVPVLPNTNVRIDEDYDRRCPVKIIPFDSHGERREFERQIEEQQGRINRMTVSEYMQRRAPIRSGVPGREATLAARRRASLPYQNAARVQYETVNRDAYIAKHGYPAWQAHLSALAATHELDLIAGGYENEISGMGGGAENSSIGPQWRADSRSGALDRHADELARNGCPLMRVNLVVN